ncbi:hypothetical protein VTI28DRAFT_5037 [Corynascus sepedonium]
MLPARWRSSSSSNSLPIPLIKACHWFVPGCEMIRALYNLLFYSTVASSNGSTQRTRDYALKAAAPRTSRSQRRDNPPPCNPAQPSEHPMSSPTADYHPRLKGTAAPTSKVWYQSRVSQTFPLSHKEMFHIPRLPPGKANTKGGGKKNKEKKKRWSTGCGASSTLRE